MSFLSRRFVVCFLVAVLIFSSFLFTPVVLGEQSSTEFISEDYWLRLARNAWQYFQPGTSVNLANGLHSAGLGFNYFTGWDLAVYINAIIDATELGIISKTGGWGTDYRIGKIVDWLQSMELTSEGLPYNWYSSDSGRPALSLSSDGTNIYDYGNLLIALHRLQAFKPELAEAINSVVKTRINSSVLAKQMLHDYPYEYYVAHGFKYFGYDNYPEVSAALNVLTDMSAAPKISVYGVELPKVSTSCEPLLLGMFCLEPNALQTDLARRLYLAHEGRYNETGQFTAMSEGNTGLDSPSYIYEWTVTSAGASWQVSPEPISPIVYFKVAVSFFALYNSSYAKSMVLSLEPRLLTSLANGYMDGVDENGRVVSSVIDKTNGMILAAAKYAIDQISKSETSPSPAATSSASPTLTPSTTPIASISESPTIAPSISGSAIITSSPSGSPIVSPSNIENSPESWLSTSIMVLLLTILGVVSVATIIYLRRRFTHQAKLQ